ncbi:calcyclin-binding protein [Dorcoceras hygrometricum]|uniref:Calcyclin-binding protein n=1 Tax=Dorcoceras hygrometricum TaxID=472368 RepID=A0A2Z7C6J1_9LAMI|nr:calcyclin-binding protein [Dorcoceras hygrometricum]
MKRRRLERFGSACNISHCLSVNLHRVGYAEADVNVGQHPCSARRKRRRLSSAKEPVDVHIRFPDVNAGQLFCSLQLVLREIVPEKSNAIVGVVTTGFECLPPSCDGLTGPDDHGPMMSTG